MTARWGSDVARILHFGPRRVGYLRLTFDNAEVAGLEGGDLHRVLELGPTDLAHGETNATVSFVNLEADLSRYGWAWARGLYLVGQRVAGEVAGVHVDGQELADVEDPVR